MNRQEIIEAIKNFKVEKLRKEKSSLMDESSYLRYKYLEHHKALRALEAIKATDEEKSSTIERIDALSNTIQEKEDLIELLNLALSEFTK